MYIKVAGIVTDSGIKKSKNGKPYALSHVDFGCGQAYGVLTDDILQVGATYVCMIVEDSQRGLIIDPLFPIKK